MFGFFLSRNFIGAVLVLQAVAVLEQSSNPETQQFHVDSGSFDKVNGGVMTKHFGEHPALNQLTDLPNFDIYVAVFKIALATIDLSQSSSFHTVARIAGHLLVLYHVYGIYHMQGKYTYENFYESTDMLEYLVPNLVIMGMLLIAPQSPSCCPVGACPGAASGQQNPHEEKAQAAPK